MKKDKIIQKEFNDRERLFEKDSFERRKLKTLVSLVPQTGKVLEVGCGYGFLSLLMLAKNREIFAADVVKGIAQKPLSKGVIFKKISQGKLPFESNTFDCIISTDVIEHVQEEENFMNESLGGKIIVATPNIYRLSFWIYSLILKKPKFPNKAKFDSIFVTDQHLREYDKKRLASLFDKNKWGKIKIFGYGLGFKNLILFSRYIPRPFDFLSNYFFATAERL